ncbi:uncharacterized protein LOC128172387 [Crassostrea angulata]|uniref:uncharacterized protein LOC128172387 n=1 Tax=Magallana angulata TaxID=2784310 RepID=UPI0022B1FA59|nr:uncharacterized protein LOC128172387 [Crassostrea angulata]
MFQVCLYVGILTISSAYVNVALNKPAYQEYPLSLGNDMYIYDANNAVDGRKTNMSWYGGQCAVSESYKHTATWWVNLTSVHSIHHIIIYYIKGSYFEHYIDCFLGFSVYVSNTTDISQGKLCFKDNYFTRGTIPVVFTITCIVHGQYVIYYNERLQGVIYPDDYSTYAYTGLCEVEVNGCITTGYFGPNCSIPCPDVNCQYCHIETGTCQGCKPGYRGHTCELVNVALNKPAYQEYPLSLGNDTYIYDANNAVDGRKTNLSWYGGQCAVSESYKHTATWWVNLTSVHSIHHIIIYYIKGSYFEHYIDCFLGFSVYVSNTTDISQGKLCFKDDNFTRSTIPVVFTITCIVHGQYVIYYNERLQGVIYPDDYSTYAYTGLCEVEVIACKRGSFGIDCNETCGHCRDINECSNVDGTCLTGCADGYEGNLCNAPCPDGFFGKDCSEKCIATCAGCNRFNGLCDSGCIYGWQGYFCNQVNVALNKPSYQLDQFLPRDDTYDASNAVDGRKSDLRMHAGQCAISFLSTTATWWVNLSSIHRIHHITILFRTSNDGIHFLGFSVYVSNTTDRLQGTLCFKDNNFTINTIPPVFTTNCSVQGQYVIYYNERLPGVVYPVGYASNVNNDLCEVEVYG